MILNCSRSCRESQEVEAVEGGSDGSKLTWAATARRGVLPLTAQPCFNDVRPVPLEKRAMPTPAGRRPRTGVRPQLGMRMHQ